MTKSTNNWKPTVGKEAEGVVKRKLESKESQELMLKSSESILAQGISPKNPKSSKTGLVVGYVQSGKTLSFTTVAGLARDNGFPLVIAIAGTSNPLMNQSDDRLRNDLDVDRHDWFVHSGKEISVSPEEIQSILEMWQDNEAPSRLKKTILFTIMKNHHHLRNLNSLLRKIDLQNTPVLIIDDEADQASLNTQANDDDFSTTYSKLIELRDIVPLHTFLQYTATPQAPLLITIIDSFSPEFVEVLEPGPEYIGGRDIFIDRNDLVKIIPPNDLPDGNNIIEGAPESLLSALRIFFIGVSSNLIRDYMPTQSMLVHPSFKIDKHREYTDWITIKKNEWGSLLASSTDSYDYNELSNDFYLSYKELLNTASNIPPFEEIMSNLGYAINATSIQEVNSRKGKTKEIEWSNSPSWILVAGQAVDRGFTVEGLTVTYMPRGVGVGNADTIQQRGRFFGYKKSYIDFCRVYLNQEVKSAFENYVTHEEIMREALREVRDSNNSLKNWKREFILSPELNPCRNNVIEHGYVRGDFANKWFTPNYIPNTVNILEINREIVDRFQKTIQFRESDHNHDICRDVSLKRAIDELLGQYKFISPQESQNSTGLLLQLALALRNNSSEVCTIYKMNPSPRSRSAINGRIKQIFQGPNAKSKTKERGETYPGDGKIYDEDNVTIQLHTINIKGGVENVPVIAIRLPARMEGVPWLIQDQNL